MVETEDHKTKIELAKLETRVEPELSSRVNVRKLRWRLSVRRSKALIVNINVNMKPGLM